MNAGLLTGKTPEAVKLVEQFISAFQQLAPVKAHPTKSMIGLGIDKNVIYITYAGRNFIDVVFPFNEKFPETLCFHKIAQVPGTTQYNHYFRMYHADDINEEVKSYMLKALQG
ncbi:hypothetical protein [Flavihumibacter petaseus]|uniref:DUF5655 domain-containing protein n=1 Tax=Flavihumibacter petaseus NBRC 106054 TaxID=1220578 RepID=A0A0E9N5A1_9BACT|nr:hypothetical protein [Flavihumibacter petaseus]GAO45142.1 hypothetical protein FPE01S_04_03850 [Flavihumibacter petaseus NBRC 106054]